MKNKFWVVNKLANEKAQILIYGYIDPLEISSADFVNELAELCRIHKVIDIKINCGGGSIFEGIAMYNAIRVHITQGIDIRTYVDGIAASMGGVLAMAGTKVYMSKFARLMTHKATVYASGNADELRVQADLCESLEGSIAEIFASRTGLSKEDAMAKYITSADRWLTAEQALTEKLIDGIYDAPAIEMPANITDERALYNVFKNSLSFSNSGNKIKVYSSWDELYAAGIDAVRDMRESNVTLYKALYKSKFGSEPMIIGCNTPERKNTQAITNDMTWDLLINGGMNLICNVRESNPSLYKKLYKEKYGVELRL